MNEETSALDWRIFNCPRVGSGDNRKSVCSTAG